MTIDFYEWGAGLLEAEGCFDSRRGSPRLRLKMTDEDVVIRFRDRLAVGYKVNTEKPGKTGRKPSYYVTLYGSAAAQLMSSVSPWLGMRRRGKIASLGVEVQPAMPRTVPWAAGLVEGDGCWPLHRDRIGLSLGMTDEDVVRTFASMWNKKVHLKKAIPGRKPMFETHLCGPSALAAAAVLRPWMGTRRTAQIDRAANT